ncbi:PPC domain-containing protein [Tautonia sociabilis]|uniref:Pre-peptidase n=1 Tax=Tautonia sociabilis TaxID=2080755 RepID=A0A432MKX5_9BACT|nr:PPC domain-containing protein [Tautonia sociabilis]RUL87786.1 pre-peptidase [Tautonia sociabilis]
MSPPCPNGPERRAGARAIAAMMFLVVLPASTRADWPRHRLDGAFPPGGRAGESVEIRLIGGDLDAVEGLWFDHPGIEADRIEGDEKPPRFRVTIAPDAPIGLHDVRAVGPLGVSNPRAFVIGDRPEAVEAEPNNNPGEAGPIAIGSVVNGQINGATDVDWFTFNGRAGQRVLIRLDAFRLDGTLDGEVRLFDASGRELAYGHDDLGQDPFVDATLPADGTYRIEVRDVVYSGAPAHLYRLTLHDGPHVDAVVPRAIAPGETATVSLLGRNLGGEPTGTLLPDGLPLERLEVTITAPPEAAFDPDRPGVGHQSSAGGGVAGFWYTFENDRGTAEPVFISQALAPVVVEQERGTGGAPPRLEPPCDVSGDFLEVGDADSYRFEAKKGQVWIIEVFADRIGSPVDASLLVQQIREDGSVVRDIGEADDLGDPGTGPRFGTGTVDPILRFQAPEDGLYQVFVGDLFNATVPAPGAVYRLVIRPERPDFLLFTAPSDPGSPEGVTLHAGGRATASVLAHRLDGFARPIRVEAEGLPAGVSAEPVVIAANQAVAPIVFAASDGAPPKLGTVRLVGRPLAEDGSPADGPARVAVAGSITRGPAPVAPARVTRGLVLAVRPDAPILLSASPSEVVVSQGEQVELTARVARRPGVEAEIQVSADALPNNVGADTPKIEKDKDEATLTLTVPGNAEPGIYTVLLRGTGKVSVPDPVNPGQAREVDLNEPSNPITLTITKK